MSSHYTLHTTVLVSTCLLIAGLTVCIIDLDQYSWGLYMVLVAIVGLLLCVAFCILGPENQAEPTIAKQLWNRATIKLTSSHRASVVINKRGGGTGGGGVGGVVSPVIEKDSHGEGLLTDDQESSSDVLVIRKPEYISFTVRDVDKLVDTPM